MKDYIHFILKLTRWEMFLCITSILFLALTEGAGIMMLVPMLGFVGINMGEGVAGEISSFFHFLFNSIGLPENLPVILVLYVLLISFREILMKWQSILVLEINQGIVQELRNRLFRSICHTEWQYFVKTRYADFAHVFTMDIGRIGGGAYNLLNGFTTLLLLLVYFAFALKLSFIVTSLVIVSSALVYFILKKHITVSKKTGKEQTGLGKRFHSEMSEFLASMKLTKIFCAEEKVAEIFEKTTGEMKRNALDHTVETAGIKMRFKIISVIILSLYIYFAAEIIAVPTEVLLLLLFVFARVTPLILSLIQSLQQFLHMYPAFSSYLTLEKSCREATEKDIGKNPETLPVEESILLKNVSFSYVGKTENNALTSVSMEIPARKTVAVVGHSGAGKSTLADVLMGLLYPDSGEILVDGTLLTPELILAWRKEVTYVPQETFLFHDTVRANLLWVKPEAGEEELWSALETAAAKDFVKNLTDGLDTVIGERGVRLSGGERQRLALARAMLVKPKVLILDEATSSLDAENEKYIRESIERLHGNVTLIIIAHRLSTIHDADKIIVLEKGRVIESGTWDELVSREGGRFYELSII